LKNAPAVEGKIEAWVTSIEKQAVAEYRKACKGLFRELLYSTPQFTGRAVANWKIGINAPDWSWDPNEGERDQEIRTSKAGKGYVFLGKIRQMGDKKWIDQAWDHNLYKFRQIKLGDQVFFSNNVQGDTDNGDSSTHYLADLQDVTYWSEKLRFVNMPYQTAAETVLIYNWTSFSAASSTGIEDHI